MIKKLSEALDQISDKHITEAAGYKKRPLWRYLGAVAAVVALAILLTTLLDPLTLSVKAVSLADYPKYEWQLRKEMNQISADLEPFFAASMQQTLSDTQGQNQAYSPVNLYMALCLLSELAADDPQLLSLLGADSTEALRKQANSVWNATYLDDGNQTLLANSIWLDQGLRYDQAVMDMLAESYYTSVYQGDLQKQSTTNAIRSWLNSQTGGLLKAESDNIQLSPETILALYSTVYFQAKWAEEFAASRNTEGVFHAPGGDVSCTYLNKQELESHYYWAEDFAAINLHLKDGSSMWILLPDEDKTTDDVLSSPDMYQLLSETYEYENSKYMKIRLQLPKFDIRASGNLKEDLLALGVTDIFNPGAADFGNAIDEELPMSISAVNQATRVAIDEEGVTAASYIELPMAGAAAPPEEHVDFIVDRPFIFVIQGRYDLPLFAGVVNDP